MDNIRFTLRIGSIGAMVATVMLIVIASIPWPFDFLYPGEEVFMGKIVLSSTDHSDNLETKLKGA